MPFYYVFSTNLFEKLPQCCLPSCHVGLDRVQEALREAHLLPQDLVNPRSSLDMRLSHLLVRYLMTINALYLEFLVADAFEYVLVGCRVDGITIRSCLHLDVSV